MAAGGFRGGCCSLQTVTTCLVPGLEEEDLPPCPGSRRILKPQVQAGSGSICLAGRAGRGVGILSRASSPRREKGACLLLGATSWARASLESCTVVEQSLTFVVLTSQAGQPPGTCNNPSMLSAVTTTLTLARGLQRLLELPGFLPSLFPQRKGRGPFAVPPLTRSARF